MAKGRRLAAAKAGLTCLTTHKSQVRRHEQIWQGVQVLAGPRTVALSSLAKRSKALELSCQHLSGCHTLTLTGEIRVYIVRAVYVQVQTMCTRTYSYIRVRDTRQSTDRSASRVECGVRTVRTVRRMPVRRRPAPSSSSTSSARQSVESGRRRWRLASWRVRPPVPGPRKSRAVSKRSVSCRDSRWAMEGGRPVSSTCPSRSKPVQAGPTVQADGDPVSTGRRPAPELLPNGDGIGSSCQCHRRLGLYPTAHAVKMHHAGMIDGPCVMM